MNNYSIKMKKDKILTKISKWREKLAQLQCDCPHENIKGEYKANTGNWCAQDDSYWIVAFCDDCGKSIYADSVKHKDLYRSLSLSRSIK